MYRTRLTVMLLVVWALSIASLIRCSGKVQDRSGQIKETVLTRTELKAVIIIYSACALGSSLRPTSQGGRSDVSSFSAVERLQEGEEVTHVFDDSGTTGHRRRTGGRREYLCRCVV